MPRGVKKRTIATGAKDAELSWLAGLLEQVPDDREAARLSCGSVVADWFTLPDAHPGC